MDVQTIAIGSGEHLYLEERVHPHAPTFTGNGRLGKWSSFAVWNGAGEVLSFLKVSGSAGPNFYNGDTILVGSTSGRILHGKATQSWLYWSSTSKRNSAKFVVRGLKAGEMLTVATPFLLYR